MDKTFLDPAVVYPVKAIQKIGTDKTVVSLLTNVPNIDMESDLAYDVFDKYLFDYGYVDETTEESEAYICVEAETIKLSPTMQSMRLYVTVFCHKNFMKIDPSSFTGLIGNRRDNLARFINHILDGEDIFGIGQLTLDSMKTITAPKGFTARELIYKIPDFKTKVSDTD